ncbi:hypothetical protein [Streptomyces sp. NRRL S-350]|uniref:hypothetical protein n=1 Tax=Streptomyces sp. NRRL S-350 TaxID=1463902 RepID=UPI0004C1DDEA|nr:hypothetical protein [Streptomyces sp. NRRL S-350]
MTATATPDPAATTFYLCDLAPYVARLLGPSWTGRELGHREVIEDGVLEVIFAGIYDDALDEDLIGVTVAKGNLSTSRDMRPEEGEDLAAFGERVAAAIREMRAQLDRARLDAAPSGPAPSDGQDPLF